MAQLRLESEGTLVPRPLSRSSYAPDATFIWTDASQRAVKMIYHWLDVRPGDLSFDDREMTVPRYRTHPRALNLMQTLGSDVTWLNIPEGGEVMYVIKENYEIVIAARGHNEKHLPHPTLVGGLAPEVISAGMVEFFEGRISRILINASGHFKPNSLSSIEVSLALFCRLPPRAFHRAFQGFVIFGSPQELGLPFEPGGGTAPFCITHVPENRTPRGRNQALDLVGPRMSLLAVTDSDAKTPFTKRVAAARKALAHGICQGVPPPFPYSLFFTNEMHKWYMKAVKAVSRATSNQMKIANTDVSASILYSLMEQGLRALWGPKGLQQD